MPMPPMPGASPSPPGAGGAPPSEAGMMTPQKKQGDEAMADVNVKLAMDVLTNTLPMYGADSEKGACILDVLRKLGKDFAKYSGEAKQLMPAEVASLLSASGQSPNQPLAGGPPPPGGAPPMMQ